MRCRAHCRCAREGWIPVGHSGGRVRSKEESQVPGESSSAHSHTRQSTESPEPGSAVRKSKKEPGSHFKEEPQEPASSSSSAPRWTESAQVNPEVASGTLGEGMRRSRNAAIEDELSIVTVNVDGCMESSALTPAGRMEQILTKVLEVEPDVLAMQEVTPAMYEVIVRRLKIDKGWAEVRRWGEAAPAEVSCEDYFNVTAVKSKAHGNDDRSSFYSFRSSKNGRHLITVRRNGWLIVNTHLESGGRRDELEARSQQLQELSRWHQTREAKAFVLVGDCNVREGEDQCLRREGWRDAWEEMGASAEGEHWTWKAGRSQFRFDRVYVHDGGGHSVVSAKMKTMPGVWGRLSDHVPLHVVLRRLSDHVPMHVFAQRAHDLLDNIPCSVHPETPYIAAAREVRARGQQKMLGQTPDIPVFLRTEKMCSQEEHARLLWCRDKLRELVLEEAKAIGASKVAVSQELDRLGQQELSKKSWVEAVQEWLVDEEWRQAVAASLEKAKETQGQFLAAVGGKGAQSSGLQASGLSIDCVEDLGDGTYQWQRSRVKAGLHKFKVSAASLEEAFHDLKAKHEDMQFWRRRAAELEEAERSDLRNLEVRSRVQAVAARLRDDDGQLKHTGCLWQQAELHEGGGQSSRTFVFKEEETELTARASANTSLEGAMHAQEMRRLRKALLAEMCKERDRRTEAPKKKKARGKSAPAKHVEVPQKIGDMGVKGKTPDGKLTYTWGTGTEASVTPQHLRKASDKFPDEPTPERALRKMTKKVRNQAYRKQRGQQVPIVARNPRGAARASGTSAEAAPGAEPAMDCAVPAYKMLHDPEGLALVREMYEFLASVRLLHCTNCDEEWPVFDKDWPQAGVACAGPKAGRCETVARCGWEQSWAKPYLCQRCASSVSYRTMFSTENLQHLGPRYEALSNLTWYESLLVARVHPVVSVITLTATGLLCYAGHVCNYYVKVMDWFQELPAVLRDKASFLIKRRKSISATSSDTRQKKPTTANRRRLEAGFAEACRRSPHVYEGSRVNHEQLAKYPENGEQEMLEQQEHVDLNGEERMARDVFENWLHIGQEHGQDCPCAQAVMYVALDRQGLDMRGGVGPDTAWELCCLDLPDRADAHTLGTSEVAQLMVVWLEENQLPEAIRAALYAGMVEDLEARGKRIITEEDRWEMQSRWIKQHIHRELEHAKQRWLAKAGEAPLDFEVDGGLVTTEAPSLTVEAEAEAAKVLEDVLEIQPCSSTADMDCSMVAPDGEEEWVEMPAFYDEPRSCDEDWYDDDWGDEEDNWWEVEPKVASGTSSGCQTWVGIAGVWGRSDSGMVQRLRLPLCWTKRPPLCWTQRRAER